MEAPAIVVTEKPAVKQASKKARQLAGEIGFASKDCEEIALVTEELASNLLKHALGGCIRLSRLEAPARNGIRIESEDKGPGIADIEQALTDGYSTAGSLGIGLGMVNRLMDELEFYSNPPTGLRIVCQRWRRPAKQFFAKGMAFGVATRAFRFLPENGDAFVIKQWEDHALAGIIDGLGHGQFAQRASHAARHYVEQHFDQPLQALFKGVDRACRATRGVVMALARFDLRNNNVAIANVGNVEVRLIGGSERFSPIVRRGVLGLNAPNPVVSEYAWKGSTILIMHSDGVGSRWTPGQFPDLADQEPSTIASRLLGALGKLDDDATVLAGRRVTTV